MQFTAFTFDKFCFLIHCDCRWYFPDTKRLDAEKMLLAEGNQQGAFLIRNCESQRGERSLSGERRLGLPYWSLKQCEQIHISQNGFPGSEVTYR